MKLYLGREDLWPKQFIGNDDFSGEIFMICKDDIIIGNCFDLYNILDGDGILNRELYKDNQEKADIGAKDKDEDEDDDNKSREEEPDDDEREEL